MPPLPRRFFARPTLEVARDLVGCLLVFQPEEGPRLVARIVETEGYTADDPACHGFRCVDDRGRVVRRDVRGAGLLATPGTAYVYFTYGMHWLLNVVTEPRDVVGAVLIRAAEPLEGIEGMRTRRPRIRRDLALANGPGKLAQAFGIDGRFHGTDLTRPPLFFARDPEGPAPKVAASGRIGIRHATDRPWRFYLPGHPAVSPGRPGQPPPPKKRSRT